MQVATIFNIMRYSIHDGPGIRTTVFFKGCPLSCWWCHNPESHNHKPELSFFPRKCITCGKCLSSCEAKAITLIDKQIQINYQLCNLCGKCAEVCPANALELIGDQKTVAEVMREIEKDLIFYDESGGGVTFSGGEALAQPSFLKEILRECKEKEIHTAIETSGYAKFAVLEEIAEYVDLFLYDLKLIDKDKHLKYIGVDNSLILDNLKKLAALSADIIVRIPIIPGINDDEENLKKSAELIFSLGIKEVHLLPYHQAGVEKYKRLNLEYQLSEVDTPNEEMMQALANIFRTYNLKVKIGG